MTFNEFHKLNPKVYAALRRQSLAAKREGRKIGVMALIQMLRWDTSVTTNHQGFKINNNYAPHYARLLMKQEKALAGYFETRCAHEV